MVSRAIGKNKEMNLKAGVIAFRIAVLAILN
jgi:hypothetical protein